MRTTPRASSARTDRLIHDFPSENKAERHILFLNTRCVPGVKDRKNLIMRTLGTCNFSRLIDSDTRAAHSAPSARNIPFRASLPEPNIHQGTHHGQSQKESCREEEACRCRQEDRREEEEVTESTRCLSFRNSRPVSGRLFYFIRLAAPIKPPDHHRFGKAGAR